MLKYIINRLFLMIIILLGVSVVTYTLIRMLPTDYIDQKFASQLAQGTVKREDIDRIKEIYGLSDSSFLGLVGGYFGWLSNLLKGDLGTSFKYGLPVGQVIMRNMWVSFGISFVALLLEVIIAVPLGVLAASKQYSAYDYTVTFFTMAGISLPTFFLAYLLLDVFSVKLGWLPFQGLQTASQTGMQGYDPVLDIVAHLILPILTLVILSIGSLMRYTRTNMLEVLNSDYIRTARAKGLSEQRVIYKHALKNTMVPLVTLLSGTLPSLFSGALITETVFSIPGIGKMSYDALVVGDVPFVMGYFMFLAVLTLLGALLSDLAYMLVDPRVKLTGGK